MSQSPPFAPTWNHGFTIFSEFYNVPGSAPWLTKRRFFYDVSTFEGAYCLFFCITSICSTI